MIIVLLVLIVLILLFGSSAVKGALGSGCLIIVAFIVSLVGLFVIGEIFSNTKWYIAIPITLAIICILFWIYRKNTAASKVTFSLIVVRHMTLIKVSQNDRFVILNPIELKIFFNWNPLKTDKFQETIFGTNFAFYRGDKEVMVIIDQTNRIASYHSGRTVSLSGKNIIEFKNWSENVAAKNEFVKKFAQSDLSEFMLLNIFK